MTRNHILTFAAAVRRPVQFWKSLSRAREAGRQGDFARAAEHYQAALAEMPSRTDVRVQMANMLKDSRQFELAEAAYRKAIKEDPLNADTHLQLGHVLKLTGRRGLALAAYERALELDPLQWGARRELAAAGEGRAQLAAFELQMRQGGSDALMTIRGQLDEMARQIDSIRRSLPDAAAAAAFPIALYSEYRRIYEPPAPTGTDPQLLITIILLAEREPLEELEAQVFAIRNQSYSRWTLVVIGDDPERRAIVARAAASDARISWTEGTGASIAAREEAAARQAAGDWVLFLSMGAMLHRHALAWIAWVAAGTACDAAVMDEEIGAPASVHNGLRPLLRQTVDLDTLLEANVYGETVAVKTSLAFDGLAKTARSQTISASRSRLLLRLIANHRVAHLPLPLVRTPHLSTGQIEGGHAEAVREYLAGRPVAVLAPSPWSPLTLQIIHTPSAPRIGIAIIIPTKDNSFDTNNLVKSLFSLAKYPNTLEVLVLNNGRPAVEDALLVQLASMPGVTVRDFPEPFNWSRFSNLGAAWTTSPYLLFANDDMVMLTQDWDDTLRSFLERADVGAIGARLLYPDDTVQHAGVLFNWRGSVIHDGMYQPVSVAGPALRWHTTRAVSAVTGAFLATRRSCFSAAGGFDEVHLAISYSDIDYALKLRAMGLRIIWSPAITLYHFESKTRGLDHLDPSKAARNEAERKVMEKRWGHALEHEPALNPVWHQATLPHRLISYPSEYRLWGYVSASASENPWSIAGEAC